MGCMEQYDDELTVCPHCGFVEDTESDNPLHMQTGTILAERYIIGKVIGYGGFGVTYIAKDVLLDTKVAVKEYLPSEFATRMNGETEVSVYSGEKGEQFYDGKKKFVDEAKKLAKFHSVSGIVKIFDSFEYNNTAYIIMELLEGETLAQMLKREKKIPEDRAVEMILPVIEALSNVHKDGIIHRDIAPDNIFITKSGDVKLIDFGAARYATTTHSRSLTVIIKPGFSPEEQYRSRGDQGPHTDVYSVAATMYKMITGQTPPDAIERRAFFENKQKDILVPMTKYVHDIEENHETAILNALNIKIEDRTPDMDTFFTELTSTTPVKRKTGTIKRIDVMRWPLWAKITVPTAAAVIAVFMILLVTGAIPIGRNLNVQSVIGENEIRVQKLVGDTFSEAEDKCKDLTLIQSGKRFSDKVQENLIMYQSIPSGSVVAKNSVIKVYVSSGKIVQPIPNVIGMDKDQAESLLKEAGFSVKTKEEYSDVIAENCVIEQSPDSSTDFHGEITLTVSKGRDPQNAVELSSETPDFKGMKFDKVLEEAKSKNIMIKVSERKYSKEFEKNAVISQSSDGGIVELVVSLGYDEMTVPDVVSQTERDAIALLRGSGFKYKVTYQKSDSADKGVVISQKTEPGAKAAPETEIEIVVSSGSEEFKIPDVVGLSFDEALSTLSEKGLAVAISLKQDKRKTEKTVLAQSPEKESKAVAGDMVILTVSTHGEVVEMPNVTGKTQSDAEKILKDKGFKVKVETDENSALKKGIVSMQSPAEKIGEAKGAEVTIWVSKGNSEEQSGSSKVASSKTSTSSAVDNADPTTADDNNEEEQNAETSNTGTSGSSKGSTSKKPGNTSNENTVSTQSKKENDNTDQGPDFESGNIIADGNCGAQGDNVKYVLYESGNMYIYGSGDMYNGDVETPLFDDTVREFIKSVDIENGITSIGDYAFSGCISLTEITLPDSVMSIGDAVFCDCSSLTTITLPDSLTSIGACAFSGCSSLTIMNLPESMTTVEDNVFRNCANLEIIKLHSGITRVGGGAFEACNNLSEVYFEGDLPLFYVNDKAFDGLSMKICYPRNNPTWDNINEENWNGGGTPTFEPYDP